MTFMELVSLWVARFRAWQLSRHREAYRRAKLASSVMVPEPTCLCGETFNGRPMQCDLHARATFLRRHL